LIKAGILEIADVFVLNKADREGADRTEREIRAMIELGTQHRDWTPPVVRTVAPRDEGTGALYDALVEHRTWAQTHGVWAQRQRRMREAIYWETVAYRLRCRTAELLAAETFAQRRRAMLDGELDPLTLAEETVATLLQRT